MSGRLIITTKKSYCPWNAANVERVLRDERLERERLERQQSEEDQSSSKRRHEPQGHINLFPEAREAEIRLTHGTSNNVEKKNCNGILPVPLGGDELNNRKSGKVPFYMQTQSQQEEKYDNSSYLGIRGNRSGKAPSDEITDKLMRDQFASREEYRKQKNDPMSRFYVDSTEAARNIYADNKESLSIAEHDLQRNCRVTSSQAMNYSLESKSQERGRTNSRKRKYNPAGGADDHADDGSEVSSASSSSSSIFSSTSTSSRDSRRHKSRRKHEYKKNKRSKHSSSSRHGRHRRENSPLLNEKKRRKDKKRKRKRRSKDRGEVEGDRQKRYHNSSLRSSPPSNKDPEERTKSDTRQLDTMRRRRHAREAREMERQRQIIR
eukprot:scaffold2704_cov162-Skeletonema_menzelii.AAC.5